MRKLQAELDALQADSAETSGELKKEGERQLAVIADVQSQMAAAGAASQVRESQAAERHDLDMAALKAKYEADLAAAKEAHADREKELGEAFKAKRENDTKDLEAAHGRRLKAALAKTEMPKDCECADVVKKLAAAEDTLERADASRQALEEQLSNAEKKLAEAEAALRLKDQALRNKEVEVADRARAQAEKEAALQKENSMLKNATEKKSDPAQDTLVLSPETRGEYAKALQAAQERADQAEKDAHDKLGKALEEQTESVAAERQSADSRVNDEQRAAAARLADAVAELEERVRKLQEELDRMLNDLAVEKEASRNDALLGESKVKSLQEESVWLADSLNNTKEALSRLEEGVNSLREGKVPVEEKCLLLHFEKEKLLFRIEDLLSRPRGVPETGVRPYWMNQIIEGVGKDEVEKVLGRNFPMDDKNVVKEQMFGWIQAKELALKEKDDMIEMLLEKLEGLMNELQQAGIVSP